MCGIGGIYHPGESSAVFDKPLRDMIQGITHRGPDEDGFFQTQDISMGMRRLKVIDLSTGTQPITNADGSLVIVVNGEIYNYEKIRQDLIDKGFGFKTKSDTEVILLLYQAYGLDFTRHFDGMFVFSIWDKNRKQLIIGRDRFGIKPLYYTLPNHRGHFSYCSELTPLLKIPGISREIDPIALDQFFHLSYILHPRSIYKGIKKLEPGHLLIASDSGIDPKSFWSLPESPQLLSEGDCRDALDSALKQSVKSMMRSDVPVGAFLSGGLDSSSVVYYMTQFTDKPIHTFSVRFQEKSYDEGDIARATSKILGTVHHEIWGKPEDIEQLPRMMRHFGEPFADPSLIPTYLVSKLARQDVTVALSGDGGDEMLGGYQTYVASALAERSDFLPSAAKRAMAYLVDHIPNSMQRKSFDSQIKRLMNGLHYDFLERHGRWKTIMNSTDRRSIYSNSFNQSLQENFNDPVFDHWKQHFPKQLRDNLTYYQYLDIKTYLVDNNLTKVDRMSMAHSLEVRIPFLDLKVFETAMALPAKFRVDGFKTKALLRQLMDKRIPPVTAMKKKLGFGVPLNVWFQHELRPYLEDTLHPDRVRNVPYLNPEGVQMLMDEHFRSKKNRNRQLWNLVCFMKWFEESELSGAH